MDAHLRLALWALYPIAIVVGLSILEPRYVGLILAVGLVIHRWRDARRLLAELTVVDHFVLGALLCLALLTALTNSETTLRLYPAAVSLGSLLMFGLSLRYPPSMIEKFARASEPNLSAEGVLYTRQVTRIWCAFFVVNGGLAAWSAFYASRELWVLYNGFIAYALMGLLFVGERLLRARFVKPII